VTGGVIFKMDTAKKIEMFLKISGLLILLSGVVIGLANLKGWLKDKDKVAVLEWVMNSKHGMVIKNPGAKKFMKRFPPPKNSRPNGITHLVKSATIHQLGGMQNASINYMHDDGSRTAHVATLNDVKAWATTTNYEMLSWLLSLLGFIEMMGAFTIELILKRKKITSQFT
jgi:hypothetical protein